MEQSRMIDQTGTHAIQEGNTAEWLYVRQSDVDPHSQFRLTIFQAIASNVISQQTYSAEAKGLACSW
jgi:hypothetical protein